MSICFDEKNTMSLFLHFLCYGIFLGGSPIEYTIKTLIIKSFFYTWP